MASTGENKNQVAEEPEVAGLDSDDDVKEEVLDLVARDGSRVTLPRKYTLMSDLVKEALEKDADAKEVVINSAPTGQPLIRIAEFMAHHGGTHPEVHDKFVVSPNFAFFTKDKWDAHFLDFGAPDCNIKDLSEFYAVMISANYMAIKSLTNLCAAKIASIIYDKDPAEIRCILNPGGDTPAVPLETARRSKRLRDLADASK